MSRVPRIRFKGFEEDWEQRKLLSITTMHARIGWQNLRTTEFLDDGKYLLITGTDFVDGKIEFTRCYYVKKERYNQDRNIQIKNGCILITKDGTLGKVAYVNDLNKPATLNAGIFNVEIRDENKVDRLYLYQYIKAPFLLEYVNQMATGGTIKHLNQNILVDFMVSMPQSMEQKKIGELFQILDHLITLHQRKLEKLKNIKKSMLENLFPQNGEKTPKIRFSGFTKDWEQRKLGEVADIIGGGTPSTLNLDYWDGTIDWYSPAEIINQIYVYRSQRKITELGLEKSSAKMLPVGTVLFTSCAGIGKTAILAKRGCTNQGFQSIVPYSNTLDSYFIFSRTEELKKYGELVGAGSTFVEVSGRQMENMQLMIPKTIDEQHIIGLLFSSLDHLITLHQSKLEKLQKIKKSMLESMFV